MGAGKRIGRKTNAARPDDQDKPADADGIVTIAR